MDPMPDLLPCPFCLSTADIASNCGPVADDREFTVTCENIDCKAAGPLCATPVEAATRWNRRAKIPERGGCQKPFAVTVPGSDLPVTVFANDVQITEAGHLIFRDTNGSGAHEGKAIFAPGEWRKVVPVAEESTG